MNQLMKGIVNDSMKKISLLVIIICSLSSVHAQVITDSLLIEGHYRSFHFTDPGESKRENLIFVMHGSGGNGIQMMKATSKLEQKAKAEKLLLIYPNGYKNYWNECRKAATSTANIENINENAFFAGMIDYFSMKYNISTKK